MNQSSGNLSATTETSLENVAADLGLKIEQAGTGRTVLLLHGGAGPMSVSAFSGDLAQFKHVITPIHPGFAGTKRPDHMDRVKELARTYVTLIERARLHDVLVIGFSIGGWIAAEMATLRPAGVAGFVLVDAAGITVPGQSVLDVFSIAPNEIANFSYHTPEKYRIDPSKMTEQQAAGMKANFATLAVYGRAQNMQDPDLRDRLASVKTPAMVVWGESDRVVTPDYGRAYAAAFPNGRFELIPECGHMPQIEQPQRLRQLIREFERDLPNQG
jgi:pimeloyl-ACP methyl ester carboxylesterase